MNDSSGPASNLTKRELFAAMAMQGMLSKVPSDGIDFEQAQSTLVNVAVQISNALLAELAKDQP